MHATTVDGLGHTITMGRRSETLTALFQYETFSFSEPSMELLIGPKYPFPLSLSLSLSTLQQFAFGGGVIAAPTDVLS
jgi:hypothetical protein